MREFVYLLFYLLSALEEDFHISPSSPASTSPRANLHLRWDICGKRGLCARAGEDRQGAAFAWETGGEGLRGFTRSLLWSLRSSFFLSCIDLSVCARMSYPRPPPNGYLLIEVKNRCGDGGAILFCLCPKVSRCRFCYNNRLKRYITDLGQSLRRHAVYWILENFQPVSVELLPTHRTEEGGTQGCDRCGAFSGTAAPFLGGRVGAEGPEEGTARGKTTRKDKRGQRGCACSGV